MGQEEILQSAEDALVQARETAIEMRDHQQDWARNYGGAGSGGAGLPEFLESMIKISYGFIRIAEMRRNSQEEGKCRCKPLNRKRADEPDLSDQEKFYGYAEVLTKIRRSIETLKWGDTYRDTKDLRDSLKSMSSLIKTGTETEKTLHLEGAMRNCGRLLEAISAWRPSDESKTIVDRFYDLENSLRERI